MEGVAGKRREALAFGRAVAKPASDQIGQCGGKIVMDEDESDKSLAEYGGGCRCALRLVADLLPEGLARRHRRFRHRCCLRDFDASFSLSDINRRQPARHAPRDATSLHAKRPGSYIGRRVRGRSYGLRLTLPRAAALGQGCPSTSFKTPRWSAIAGFFVHSGPQC